MVAVQNSEWTPRDAIRVLFRQRRRMAIFFIVVLLLTMLLIALYPRGYSSEAKLFLRIGRESVALDPTATTGQTIMMQKTRVDEVNSALQLLLSRNVLSRSVAEVGAERVIKDVPAARGSQQPQAESGWIQKCSNAKTWLVTKAMGFAVALRLSDPGSPEEMAIRKLESRIKTYAPKESAIITVSYTAASPELAHDVVQAVIRAFLEEHVRVNQSQGSLKFFTEQSSRLKEELIAAEADLRSKKNSFKISTIESRRGILARQLEEVELQKLLTGRELAYSKAEISELKRSLALLQPELVTSRVNGFANEAKDLMRQKLYELEIEESKLRSRYSENHPLLEQVQRQRAEAAKVLQELPDERTQTTAALNPNQRALELDLLQAQAKEKALQSRATAVEKQLAALDEELKTLNSQETQLAALQRNVEILDGKYRMHIEKMEQARVNDELGREKMSNIEVAQPASLISKPTSPRKTVILGGGLLLAVFGASALAIISELLDPTLRTVEQVERELGVPVLVSVPIARRQPSQKASENEIDRNGVELREQLEKGAFRVLAQTLLRSSAESGDPSGKAVGVIGCEADQARSSVAAGLAFQAAADSSVPVLLVDADKRHRRITQRFGLNGSPGWRDVLRGTSDPSSCIHPSAENNLALMTPGSENGHAAATGAAFKQERIRKLKSQYGLVLIDMPAAHEFDSPPSAEWLDETVLVIEAERTHTESARRAKLLLERSGVRVVGAVFANERDYVPRWAKRYL